MRGRKVARASRRSLAYPLILTAAALWLALTVLVVAGIQPAAASSRLAANPAIAQDAGTPTTPTAAPTQAPPTATDTPVPADTPTDTPVPTDTPTDTPAPVDNGGGAGGGGGGGGGGSGGGGDASGGSSTTAGPEVTRVVLSQPTVAVGNDNAVPGLAGATFGSNGLLLATTMSCVVGLLGLTVAGIALVVLMRKGYGPFLRALLRGKRAGKTRDRDGADDVSGWNTPDARTATDRNGRTGRGEYLPNAYAPNSNARNGQGSASRRPPASGSRADWR